jgi:hypothetical protein
MAQYTINYLTGETETVNADHMVIDYDAKAYVFRAGDIGDQPEAVIPSAFVPAANIRSIHRTDSETTRYPYTDGDVTVLGPEIIASLDGDAISWKGVHYSRHPYPTIGKVTG